MPWLAVDNPGFYISLVLVAILLGCRDTAGLVGSIGKYFLKDF
jgi:hypothetical protein